MERIALSKQPDNGTGFDKNGTVNSCLGDCAADLSRASHRYAIWNKVAYRCDSNHFLMITDRRSMSHERGSFVQKSGRIMAVFLRMLGHPLFFRG